MRCGLLGGQPFLSPEEDQGRSGHHLVLGRFSFWADSCIGVVLDFKVSSLVEMLIWVVTVLSLTRGRFGQLLVLASSGFWGCLERHI